MAKERIINLPETKGQFQLKGIVSGTAKDGFYSESKTRTQKDMRRVNFGVEYMTDKTQYLAMSGMVKDFVYFSKKSEKKGEKSDTQKVQWADRFIYKREGYRLLGNNIGVCKIIDKDGKSVNDKKILVEYDACKEVGENLKDGKSVFTRGALEFSSFTDDKGNMKRAVKLVPNQVSLCADVDFKDEKYEMQSDFNQVIIFTSIAQIKDDAGKDTGKFSVSAKIVTYNSIEDAEFIIKDAKLANMFRKNLKPYTAIKVSGHMEAFTEKEEAADDDNWGEADALNKARAPVKREFVITGAMSSTIDTETYSKDKVETALAQVAKSKNAESNFGNNESDGGVPWGETNLDNVSDEDDDWD